jgi:ankyrin repeat protein
MKYKSVIDVLARVQDVVEFGGVDLKSVNQTGIFGNSPLSVVMSWRDIDAATLLVDAGANINARGECGDTALHLAALFGDHGLVEFLLRRGASVDAKNSDNETPLDVARARGWKDIARLLEKCSSG